MTELERRELEQLKARQTDLALQLSALGRKLEAFEERIVSPQINLAASQPKPIQVLEVPPVQSPVAVPPPQPVAPPIIPHARVPVIEKALTEPASVPVASPIFPTPHFETAPTHLIQTRVEKSKSASDSTQTIDTLPGQPASGRAPTKKASLEMRLGTFWLVRIGIVMLLTSLVFFGSYAYQNFIPRLGPVGKISLLYLASGGLAAAGWLLQRKQKSESLRNYAQVLLAGGLAAVYFTTYAAHHFPNLEVIHSAVVDGVLLCGWAGFIIWLADRGKSEVLALFAILLAYYASIITDAGLFTLYSNLLLTVAAVVFLVRNRWATATFASLVATYVSYAFWRFFHAGHWQWATPSEGLWTGNYFLIAYWILFTAAAFMSKHEQFNGGRRASFLSINNGAFFSAFLLTMIEVQQGGFWKFSLGYGIILLGLSALASKVLPGDRLFRNAYLTQGLLLVTLGIITHITGLKLCLVLGTESVILLMLGEQLKSRVMQGGSMIAALLACGWAAVTLTPFDHNGLITGAAIGALMLWNAFWLRRETTFEQSLAQPRNVFYTLLALCVWMLTTWQNVTQEHRGLAFACESAVLLLAARPLRNRTLVAGAYAFAAVALGCELFVLQWQLLNVLLPMRIGLWQAIAVGTAMVFNALWEQRESKQDKTGAFHPPVAFFSTIGLLIWLVATCVFTPGNYLAPLLALEALLLTLAYYPTRLKEAVLFGQVYLLTAQALWLENTLTTGATHPWWNPVTFIAVTLALAAWWQHQRVFALKQRLGLVMQAIYALGVVGLFYFWLQPQFTALTWLAFTSLLAILLTIYAVLNRFWFLAATGQMFLVASIWQFGGQLFAGKPEWYPPLAPIAALLGLSLWAVNWFAARPNVSAAVSAPVLGIGRAYRILAVGMSLCWVQNYIPAQEHIWTLCAMGLGLFLAASWRRSVELLVFAAVFTLAGLGKFWIPLEGAPTVYWPNLFAILALLAQEQIAKHKAEKYRLPWQVNAAAIVIGGLSAWLYVSRLILERSSGFYLTMGWAGLALALFTAGLALRERVYRWLGLAVLASALGRVVLFDVWNLQTIYRILTFMAMGIVLLVLGFIYNRYQEKIREWL